MMDKTLLDSAIAPLNLHPLTRANATLVKTTVQRMLKQSNLTATLAEDSHSVDVAAGALLVIHS